MTPAQLAARLDAATTPEQAAAAVKEFFAGYDLDDVDEAIEAWEAFQEAKPIMLRSFDPPPPPSPPRGFDPGQKMVRVDLRERIRRSKAWYSTTGPPTSSLNDNAPGCEPGARPAPEGAKSLAPTNIDTHKAAHGASPVASTPDFCARLDPDDLIFVKRICHLWRLGPQALSAFLLAYTQRNLARLQLETELDRFLEQGEDP